MKKKSDNISSMQIIMERAIEKNPHNSNVIKAFSPIFIVRNQLMENLRLKKMDSFCFDEVKFRQGVPLIKQGSLFQKDDPWKDIVVELVKSAKGAFPNLRKDWECIESAAVNGNISIDDYLRAVPETEGVVNDWAAKVQASPAAVNIVLRQLARIILEARLKDIAKVIQGIDWQKGYCPICGTHPVIAQIQEKIGHRYLYCPQCSYKWHFSRVICPYCEHHGQQGMDFFFIEDNERESVFACDHCKRYLITLNQATNLNDYNLDVSAISLIHLDFIMQEKGFLPMAVCEWNIFQGNEVERQG